MSGRWNPGEYWERVEFEQVPEIEIQAGTGKGKIRVSTGKGKSR